MAYKQDYEKQIAARFAYMWYMQKYYSFDFKEKGLYRELAYMDKAYGDNEAIKKMADELYKDDEVIDKVITSSGTGEYRYFYLVGNTLNKETQQPIREEAQQPMKRKYELKVREQYATGRCLNYEFEDIDEMVDFVKQTIQHSVPVVVFEFKAIETGE